MKCPDLIWFLWILLLQIQVAFAQVLSNGTGLVCKPFGTCEPCPEDALHEPFCQPFGNRRLMHCLPASSATTTSVLDHRPTNTHATFASDAPLPTHTAHGETLGWESCGRIVEKERADFYEFFASNLLIAVAAIAVVLARTKRLQAMQARQLAARIGLVRESPGGWSNG
ncbi:hypothetical protein PYCCODRAFT_1452182 [Trametes coccinea BRFM310]|uniref:Uncharacterized protein n=1 Tax=Trametes coccinea (strain BRFM310) TaxID=1353009 RepID=A0A1Y2INL1_TRAC3|nr:hypothetical protein PYCCODRAFT_1452182 [Trametes coccinea BRFM310]